jgi:nucleoside-diphosphate-sugar epimerase
MRILLTGGNGFIGAWITERLVSRGAEVRIFDVAERRRLIDAIARPGKQVSWHVGDIVKTGDVVEAARGCTGLINLAGILTPDCRASPIRGAEINLIGTLNAFEAVRQNSLFRLVYTSSAGVFGPHDGERPQPATHYGAFKLACEGSARAYWHDHRIASVGFRPFIVYGPGRETGSTAGPSLACRAAVCGDAYTITYTGTAGLVYVDDVAAAYEAAVLANLDGAHVFNMMGETASTDDVITAIRAVAPDARIDAAGPDIGIAPKVADGDLRQKLPGVPHTSLRDGIARTIAFYREHPDL